MIFQEVEPPNVQYDQSQHILSSAAEEQLKEAQGT
jgi:hypothetical protein